MAGSPPTPGNRSARFIVASPKNRASAVFHANLRFAFARECARRSAVAGVVELVDAPDSKSGSERSVGSIPTARTTFFSKIA
jgi:hypothetical protein